MPEHRCYRSIVEAVKDKRLKEPFSASIGEHVCPHLFAEDTYGTFLSKHAKGDPGKDSELFNRVSPGLYGLIRPIKYNIDC